jgi:hypothetical protein
VYELRVGAHGHDIATHFLEAVLLLCQSSELGRSNESEVGRIEEQQAPTAVLLLLCQIELPEPAVLGIEGGQFKVGDVLSYLNAHQWAPLRGVREAKLSRLRFAESK